MEPIFNSRTQRYDYRLGKHGEFPNKRAPYKMNFFSRLLDDEVVDLLRDDVRKIKLKSKDNDLYKFKQSRDLRTEIQSKKLPQSLHDFIDMMLGPIRKKLESNFDITLSEKHFDITVSRYERGNYLLCHNDDIRNIAKKHARAIAFVFYLNSRPWDKGDGGYLQLYDCDKKGEPIKINNSIFPVPNSLVAFRTSATSWHSVQEVYCDDDVRWSINGWFHVDNAPPPPPEQPLEELLEPCPLKMYRPIVPADRLVKFIEEYVNPDYMLETTCATIRKKFKRKSEINLTNFLVKEKFEEIEDALAEACQYEVNMIHNGPYNKRNYKSLKMDRLPPVCRDLFDVFRSELFFMVLSRLTGLELSPPNLKERIGDTLDKKEDDKEAGTSGQTAKEEGRKAKVDEYAEDEDEEEDEDEDEEDESDDSDDDDEEDEDEDEDEEDDDDDDEEDDSEEDNSEDEETDSELKGAKKEEKDDKDKQELESSTESKLLVIEELDEKGSSSENLVIVTDETKSKDSGSPPKEEASTSQGESKKRPMIAGTSKIEEKRKSPKKKLKKAPSDPLARFEFRHFEHGSYTLIHDHGYELGEQSALDVILHFNHHYKVNYDHGGYLSYIDGSPDEDLHNMDYELLTVSPMSNCLTLVYRCDESTVRFLKHINKTHRANYQDLSCVYYERSTDLPKSTGGIVDK